MFHRMFLSMIMKIKEKRKFMIRLKDIKIREDLSNEQVFQKAILKNNMTAFAGNSGRGVHTHGPCDVCKLALHAFGRTFYICHI